MILNSAEKVSYSALMFLSDYPYMVSFPYSSALIDSALSYEYIKVNN